jgi:hypothetical protein
LRINQTQKYIKVKDLKITLKIEKIVNKGKINESKVVIIKET